MKNTYILPKSSIQAQWYVVDAQEKCLGRLATTVAQRLRGKNKVVYHPSQDTGDYVIIINADKVKVSGQKQKQKTYMRHSGRPGGKTLESFNDLQARLPHRILRQAVKGMLPKNRLGRQLLNKLKVYAGTDHPHSGQKPQSLRLESETRKKAYDS